MRLTDPVHDMIHGLLDAAEAKMRPAKKIEVKTDADDGWEFETIVEGDRAWITLF